MSEKLVNKNEPDEEVDVDLNPATKKIKTEHVNEDVECADFECEPENDEDTILAASHSEFVGIKERLNKDFKRFKGLIKQM